MRPILLMLFLLSFRGCLFSQTTNIQWEKSLGGSQSDAANSIKQTLDRGYIVAGYSYSNNDDVTSHHGDSTTSDCWIVKLNSIGNIEWQKSYGGIGNEVATSVMQTTDGGYILIGHSDYNNGEVTGNHGNVDIWVVKIDTTGNIEWTRSYGGSGSDDASSIIQTTDGGYLIGGSTTSTDGNVTSNHGGGDYWLIKINSTGSILWQKTYGGSYNDWGYDIIQANDGGYIMGGISESVNGDVTGNHGSVDYWIVKTDSLGVLQWEHSYGGAGYDRLGAITKTNDGGCLLTGLSDSTSGDVTGNHGSYDFWIVKLSNTGILQWEQSYGGSSYDAGGSAMQTDDGGYLITGVSSSANGDVTSHHGDTLTTDYWVLKVDSMGLIRWENSYGGSTTDHPYSLIQASDGSFTIAGESFSNDGDVTNHHADTTINDFWIVNINQYPAGLNEIAKDGAVKIFPNPTLTNCKLKVDEDFIGAQYQITDVSGRLLVVDKIQSEISDCLIADFSTGIYLLEVSHNNHKHLVKIIKR